ncbi:MAG TPA: hypothetical protein VID27_11420 [Blastocatellia bacterium]
MRKTICALMAILCLSIGALTETPQTSSTQKASFDQLLGEDDGAAFAILFSANQKGNLDTCD